MIKEAIKAGRGAHAEAVDRDYSPNETIQHMRGVISIEFNLARRDLSRSYLQISELIVLVLTQLVRPGTQARLDARASAQEAIDATNEGW